MSMVRLLHLWCPFHHGICQRGKDPFRSSKDLDNVFRVTELDRHDSAARHTTKRRVSSTLKLRCVVVSLVARISTSILPGIGFADLSCAQQRTLPKSITRQTEGRRWVKPQSFIHIGIAWAICKACHGYHLMFSFRLV